MKGMKSLARVLMLGPPSEEDLHEVGCGYLHDARAAPTQRTVLVPQSKTIARRPRVDLLPWRRLSVQ
jgi:hypothetical protein